MSRIGGALDREGETLLAGVQGLHCPPVLNAVGNAVRYRCQSVERRCPERSACKQSHDPNDLIGDEQRIAGEGDHPLAPRPILVVDARVTDHRIREVGLAFQSDQADF
jgi:hypothetical protein